jgi:hypothetical protein
MYAQKKVLCSERLRRVRQPFGWVDSRLIREDWLRDCSPTAWALYLFWVTVADAQGLSYYADASVARRLRITSDDVSASRKELIRAGLLAYEPPLVQVLSLERRMKGTLPDRPEASEQVCRDGRSSPEGAVLVGDVLRSWTQGGER